MSLSRRLSIVIMDTISASGKMWPLERTVPFLIPARLRLVTDATLDQMSTSTQPRYQLIPRGGWVLEDRTWVGKLPSTATAGLVVVLPFCRGGQSARVVRWEPAQSLRGYVVCCFYYSFLNPRLPGLLSPRTFH